MGGLGFIARGQKTHEHQMVVTLVFTKSVCCECPLWDRRGAFHAGVMARCGGENQD